MARYLLQAHGRTFIHLPGDTMRALQTLRTSCAVGLLAILPAIAQAAPLLVSDAIIMDNSTLAQDPQNSTSSAQSNATTSTTSARSAAPWRNRRPTPAPTKCRPATWKRRNCSVSASPRRPRGSASSRQDRFGRAPGRELHPAHGRSPSTYSQRPSSRTKRLISCRRWARPLTL